jgi:hypothetical protein
MRPRASIPAAVLAGSVLVLAGCGSTATYSLEKTRACLVRQPGVVVGSKVDFVASNALGGAISVRLLRNEVTLAFALDRKEAARIVYRYERVAGKNIGLTDVLRPVRNVVALWATHPSDTALQTIHDCLK